MDFEPSTEIQCPYCGETFTGFVDLSQGSVTYTEDCQVCCQPILITVHVEDLEQGDFRVEATVDN